MEEISTPFLLLLNTIRRAVGVPKSVNTVSKFTVSREKARIADEEVVIPSEIQDGSIKPRMVTRVKMRGKNLFIYEKRL